MIRLIILCLLLAGAVWLGINLHQEQGMVMVAVGGKSYEMNLWVGVAILFIAFIAFYFTLRFISGFLGLSQWASDVRKSRRHKKSQVSTNRGMLELAQGHWRVAEKYLIQGAQGAEQPLVNYLAAAKAAQELGAEQKRDEYLALAHDATKGTDMAVGLTQAKLQLNHGQYEQSLATLKHLRTLAPKHPYVLDLTKTLYIHLKDWSNLIKLLPTLVRQDVITEPQRHELELLGFRESLLSLGHQDIKKSEEVWSQMPRSLHHTPDVAYIYAHQLLVANQNAEAESVIKGCLKKEWDENLATLYGNFKAVNPNKSLSVAEGWLKHHPESAGLLLTCGRLAAQNELWGKAQRYLEACLKIEKKIEAYAVLGLIYEKMDKPALSAECYRKGMLESTQDSQASNPLLEHQESKD